MDAPSYPPCYNTSLFIQQYVCLFSFLNGRAALRSLTPGQAWTSSTFACGSSAAGTAIGLLFHLRDLPEKNMLVVPLSVSVFHK